MKYGWALLLLFWLSSAVVMATPKWFDQSHEIFLTQELNLQASHYRDFPLFWWNFLMLDGAIADSDLEQLCSDLSLESGDLIQKLPCHFDLQNLKIMTQDWLRDLPRRQEAPSPLELKHRFAEVIGQASLPLGRNLLEVLRIDPLRSLQDLKVRVEKRMQMDLQLKGGFLFDRNSQRVLIPLQLGFTPSDSEKTQKLVDGLKGRCANIRGCTSLALFGPHAGTRENEMQIRADVDTVSRMGIVALVLLCAFIIFSKRSRLLNLVPLLIFSIVVSAWVTILVFGKIHGITLAFGPGIVGLSMDYGIHSCFLGTRSRKTWRANFVGLLTTIVIMVILGFSAIPLLRQMMFFATFGLCFNYLVFYLFLRRWPRWFEVPFYGIHPEGAWMKALAVLFLVGAPLIFLQTVHLDVQHLNFESAKTRELREWFFRNAGSTSPYLIIENTETPLTSSLQFKTWSENHRISFEGIANYLPDTPEQKRYLESWRNEFCPTPRLALSEVDQKFFAPFLTSIDCKSTPSTLHETVPDYLRDFHHAGHFVGLFFPKDDAEITTLQQAFPEVTTPREIFASFPRIFYRELLWMVPLAFLGAFFFLWLHYRHIGWSTLAVVPFLTGLGCYAWMALLFHLPVSFISLIGLLMVFGCSLDYGVFVMDFILFRKDGRPGVWSALTLCCFATAGGFAPLVFAQHPVLNDLGQALLWGSIGTYVGSLWGIPFVYGLFQRLNK